MRLAVVRYGGAAMSYDSIGGLHRRMTLLARVDDSHDDDLFDSTNGPFHNRAVRIEISSPTLPEALEKFKAQENVHSFCGVIKIRTNIEPKSYELDGEIFEEEPIQVILVVESNTFETTRRQLSEAYDRRCVARALITLAGQSLPPPKGSLGFISLKDLDISKDTQFAISRFHLSETLYIDRMRGRILPLERASNEKYGITIPILVIQARYDFNVSSAYFHSISCEGRVARGHNKPYHNAAATVEFKEYEQEQPESALPRRAPAGEFGYTVKDPRDEYSSTHFWFRLNYIAGDVQDLLLPLLTPERGTQISLNITLMSTEDDILKTTDQLLGDVRYYSFEVIKIINAEER